MRHGSTRAISMALLAASLFAPSARAGEEPPLPDTLLGVRVAPLLLLSRPDVRADLGLSAEQTASAERAIRNLYVQAQALRSKPNNAETIRARRAIDDDAFTWIDKWLSPDQQKRLDQIDLQWEGPAALVSRPTVTTALHLDREQVGKLKEAIVRHKKGHLNADEVLAEVALSHLTESQRETWKAMLGKPIPFRNHKS